MLLETFEEAHALLRRAQENDAFHRYLVRRKELLVALAIAMVLVAIALAAGTVVFLGGSSALLVLPSATLPWPTTVF